MPDHLDALHRLDARLRALEDERALRDLVSRYAFYADSGQHEEWVQLFTEDGAVELVGPEATGTYGDHVRFSGHDALRRFIDDPQVHMALEGRCMHLTSGNIRVQVEDDVGIVDAYYSVLLREGDQIVVANGGFTRLTCRRTGSGWRIAHRLRYAMGTAVDVLRTAFPEPRPPSPDVAGGDHLPA